MRDLGSRNKGVRVDTKEKRTRNLRRSLCSDLIDFVNRSAGYQNTEHTTRRWCRKDEFIDAYETFIRTN